MKEYADSRETPDLSQQRTASTSSAEDTVQSFPCASCGSRMIYDPERGMLFCAYCKSTEEIPSPTVTAGEYLYDPDCDRFSVPNWERMGSYTLACASCGAEILTEKKAHTATCPFCGASYVSEPSFSREVIPPETMMPFSVPEASARKAFTAWAGKQWLAPFGFRRAVAVKGEMRGVYLPAFTYDTSLYTAYRGEGGRRHTKTYTTRVNGKTVTRTRTVMRWYPISGEEKESLDDILVPAEAELDTDLFGKLGPFSTKVMRAYHPAFLAGFHAERYELGVRETFATAEETAKRSIERKIRASRGYDDYRFMQYNHRFERIAFKHILLPVWFASYMHKGKLYRFFVNGETGKVAGRRPYSALKIAGLVLLGLGAVALLLWLFITYGG